jgi:hypothetical protein
MNIPILHGITVDKAQLAISNRLAATAIGGTDLDNKHQSTKSSGGKSDGNGNDDSNHNDDKNKGNGGSDRSTAGAAAMAGVAAGRQRRQVSI